MHAPLPDLDLEGSYRNTTGDPTTIRNTIFGNHAWTLGLALDIEISPEVATVLFVAFMAVYFAVAGWVGERLRGRRDPAGQREDS